MPQAIGSAEPLGPERPANEERRASPRYGTTLSVRCFSMDGKGGLWQGQVRDLSTLGVGLVLARPVETSAVLEIELRARQGSVMRSVLGRVAHVQPLRAEWLVGGGFVSELSGEELRFFQAEAVRPKGEDSRRWVRFPCNVETVCYTNETVPGER